MVLMVLIVMMWMVLGVYSDRGKSLEFGDSLGMASMVEAQGLCTFRTFLKRLSPMSMFSLYHFVFLPAVTWCDGVRLHPRSKAKQLSPCGDLCIQYPLWLFIILKKRKWIQISWYCCTTGHESRDCQTCTLHAEWRGLMPSVWARKKASKLRLLHVNYSPSWQPRTCFSK